MTVGTPRAERRRNTEARILSAARLLFAERGYERATVRAIAAAAEVDPALIIQYFGSKQELFAQVVRIPADQPPSEQPAEMIELLLASISAKFGDLPQASVAMLRSMLTNPEAAATARATLDRQIEQIGIAIPAADARLRAALIMTTMMGLVIAHQLLDVSTLRDVPPREIADLLRPCFQILAGIEA